VRSWGNFALYVSLNGADVNSDAARQVFLGPFLALHPPLDILANDPISFALR
jgi:hypothetical protein